MESIVFSREDKHCKLCKHFKELGHVAHFCHAKEAVMANNRAQLCANYMPVREEEKTDKLLIASRR